MLKKYLQAQDDEDPHKLPTKRSASYGLIPSLDPGSEIVQPELDIVRSSKKEATKRVVPTNICSYGSAPCSREENTVSVFAPINGVDKPSYQGDNSLFGTRAMRYLLLLLVLQSLQYSCTASSSLKAHREVETSRSTKVTIGHPI